MDSELYQDFSKCKASNASLRAKLPIELDEGEELKKQLLAYNSIEQLIEGLIEVLYRNEEEKIFSPGFSKKLLTLHLELLARYQKGPEFLKAAYLHEAQEAIRIALEDELYAK